MSNSFDPYHVWLGIPPAEQPPSHYRLLALAAFEDAPEVIENAADRQMAHVRRAASGKNGDASQRILNEISAARRCLLDQQKKRAYDDELRAAESPAVTAAPPGIEATTEWAPTKPSRPPAPPPPKRSKNGQQAPEVAEHDRWKGSPIADGPIPGPVIKTASPVSAPGVVAPSSMLQRTRSRKPSLWVWFAALGALAILPVLALLYALASMSQTPSTASSVDAAGDVTPAAAVDHRNRNDDGAESSGLPAPGEFDDSDSDADDSDADFDEDFRRPLRGWRPFRRDRKDDRDPLDDTPSFGGSQANESDDAMLEETVTVSAKKPMIQLALFKLPPHAATGIHLTSGQTVKLQIEGTYRVGGQAHDLRGPSGLLIAVGTTDGPATQHFKGAEEVEFTVQKSGQLFLAVDDWLPVDNQGELTVEVAVYD